MSLSQSEIEDAQRSVCAEHAAEYMAASDKSKSGFAVSTNGLIPINGLRHPLKADTSGWYIWCGEAYSENPDFFVPLHTYHLYDTHPEIAGLLGLPPGYRFLLAGEHLDIWFDPLLLEV